MDKLNHLDVALPGHGKADFMQPIHVSRDALHAAHLYFGWSQPTVGFGECQIVLHDDGPAISVVADTEGMGREWLRRALYAAVDALVDQAVIQ